MQWFTVKEMGFNCTVQRMWQASNSEPVKTKMTCHNLDLLLNLHGLDLDPSTYSDFFESFVDYIKYDLSQEKNLTCTDRLGVIR